jgi:hypothetical protein
MYNVGEGGSITYDPTEAGDCVSITPIPVKDEIFDKSGQWIRKSSAIEKLSILQWLLIFKYNTPWRDLFNAINELSPSKDIVVSKFVDGNLVECLQPALEREGGEVPFTNDRFRHKCASVGDMRSPAV